MKRSAFLRTMAGALLAGFVTIRTPEIEEEAEPLATHFEWQELGGAEPRFYGGELRSSYHIVVGPVL